VAYVAQYLIDKSAMARLHETEVTEKLRKLLQRGQVSMCGMTLLELLYSAPSHDDYRRLAARLEGAREWLITEDIDFWRAREVQEELAITGRHREVSIPGLVIAAVAERHRVTVLHYDADYDLIAEVTGQPTEWVVPRGSVN
jgi:predicted nucleic acid-binding protein